MVFGDFNVGVAKAVDSKGERERGVQHDFSFPVPGNFFAIM